MMRAVLDAPMEIHFGLKRHSIILNLAKELSIDTNNVLSEIAGHASKHSMWSVLHILASHKVDMIEKEITKCGDSCPQGLIVEHKVYTEHRNMLYKILEAFNHRKVALLELLGGTDDSDSVLSKYRNNLLNLWAL